MALTQAQIDIVKSTVPILKEHGTTVTSTMYNNMLSENPELKNIFSLRSQGTGAQPAALANSVLAYATYIDDLPKLQHAVERIAQKHVSLYIKPEQYAVVAKYLIGAFGIVLGDAFTDEIKDAWVAAYLQLADIFIKREGELYKTDGDWTDWRQFKIAKKELENEAVASFYLEPVDGKPLPTYLPGQYISLQVPVPQAKDLKQSRQFSLSEAPTANPNHYRVSVKREETLDEAEAATKEIGQIPGLVSNILHAKYEAGDIVELSAPHGDFFVDPSVPADGKPLVLLSAGVGATPLRSILDAVLASPSAGRPINWIHAARKTGTSLFVEHAREVAAKHENVNTKVFIKNLGESDVQGKTYDYEGRLDLPKLEEEKLLHLDSSEAAYYICGPEAWMLSVREWLLNKGVSPERLNLELFNTGDVV